MEKPAFLDAGDEVLEGVGVEFLSLTVRFYDD
jgi:hypothetical protein